MKMKWLSRGGIYRPMIQDGMCSAHVSVADRRTRPLWVVVCMDGRSTVARSEGRSASLDAAKRTALRKVEEIEESLYRKALSRSRKSNKGSR